MERKNEWPELFTIAEVAALFRVHPSTIYRMIDEGKLQAVRPTPGTVRVPREAIEGVFVKIFSAE